MRVCFDLAAGRAGLGHVGRCIGLLQALRRHGVEMIVRCQGDDGHLMDSAGFTKDLGRVAGNCDWIIRDRPEEMSLEDVRLLPRQARLALIDDSGPARRFADVVVGPATSHWRASGEGALLQGVKYALLREEFAGLSAPVFDGPLVMTLGSVDPARLTMPLLRALESIGRELRVIGPRDLRPAELGDASFELSRGMASAFEGASLVVTAYGHSLLEATAAGLPTVFISWDHQSRADAATVATRLPSALYVGAAGELDVRRRVVDSVSGLLASASAWNSAREATRRLDGRGAQRVAEHIIAVTQRAEDPWRQRS